jgi:hypothetical protein
LGGFPGVHGVFGVHGMHAPLSQTWSVPHVVPFCTAVALTHIVLPEAHDVMPDMQTLPLGLHACPEEHGPQLPPLQTCPFPHGVPSLTWPVAVHTGTPVVHDVVPVWHALPFGEHAADVTHATQPPSPLHTSPVPQGVPAWTLVALPHIDWPVEHDDVPDWHAFPLGLHGAPPVHAVHIPW